jgi:hypothetical protein
MRRTLQALVAAVGLMALAIGPVATISSEAQGISTMHQDGSLVAGTRVTGLPPGADDINVA